MTKKTILSGSTVTGDLTIGNYIGAISNWKKLQDEYDCYYMVADLHGLTVFQDPKEFQKRGESFFAQYLALGLDPEKNTVFFQSHVPEHAELSWVLTCLTPMGYLNRMTQFKEKSQRHEKNINTGLFTYPILMAADILLYRADLVPVGEDQKQHLELCRDIVGFFENRYGEGVLTLPEPYIGKQGARVMSLQDATKKMSKSDENLNGFVSIIDDPKKIIKKFKSAVTDSGTEISFSNEKPGISNLLTIYSSFSGQTIEEIVKSYEGKMYGHLKVDLGELVVEKLRPIQDEYHRLMNDRSHLQTLMKKGAEKARARAHPTLISVYDKVGLVRGNS
jgi:tryptophanyl-tRNA synthetase